MSKVSERTGIMYHLPNGKRYYALTLPGKTEGTFRARANAETLELWWHEEIAFCWVATLFVDTKPVWRGTRYEIKVIRGRRYPGITHYFLTIDPLLPEKQP